MRRRERKMNRPDVVAITIGVLTAAVVAWTRDRGRGVPPGFSLAISP
jgi:hypothetical protein